LSKLHFNTLDNFSNVVVDWEVDPYFYEELMPIHFNFDWYFLSNNRYRQAYAMSICTLPSKNQ